MIGGHPHGHHPIVSEVEKGEVHEEDVPKELRPRPLEPYHGVNADAVNYSLTKYVGNLNRHL